MRQKNQHIVVTGGGSGIGLAIAKRMAKEGAKVTVMGRRIEPLKLFCTEIEKQGIEAKALRCDIRDRQAVDQAFAEAREGFGGIRALVANSGIGGGNEDGEGDRFDDLIQTNLMGTYYCLRAAQRNLILDGEARHLVMISSCLARFGVPGYTGYCASKAGLLGLTRALSLEVASENIQVNSICPGWVDTEMARQGLQGMAKAMTISYEEAHRIAMKSVPLGRMSKPTEIAGMVAWLLSLDGLGITGQGLDINGGSWMG
jgi:NAD(P)-dependent dehydrogenase (short-subunit alcohol dehydrogenase family)